MKFKFSKNLRLLTYEHFSFVFQNPKRVSFSKINILGRLNTIGYPRIGLAISKKSVKRSNERNRIKRLTRESFRLNQYILPDMDFVVISKRGISDFDNFTVMQTLEKIWRCYCR